MHTGIVFAACVGDCERLACDSTAALGGKGSLRVAVGTVSDENPLVGEHPEFRTA